MHAVLNVKERDDHLTGQQLFDEHRTLVSRIAVSRDKSAFEALFRYFGPRVKALMLKSGADHAQAEDLVQDVMMTLWRKVHLYSPERGSVGTWIFTIARNARIDRLRRSSSRPHEDVDGLELPSSDTDASDEVLANQQAERVAAALAELPVEQRKVIELAYLCDMPQSEVAEKLDVPLGTVKSRMRLAYAKLKTELEDVK